MIQKRIIQTFRSLLKKESVSDPSETPLNHHWTPRDGLGEAVCSKTSRRDQFHPISSRHMLQNESYEPFFFKGLVSNPSETPLKPFRGTSGQPWKAVCSKTSRQDKFGHTKIAKNHQFLTFDTRIPAEGCSKKIKSQKTLSF